jgi:two-component system osmolarity sensor histidine kinase EnvZ
MFLKNFKFKKFIPRSLYGRFLLVVIMSALIIQLVSIYVFYYTHLDVITKHMARSVIAEMVFVKESINKPGYENLLRELAQNTGLKFSFQENRKLKRKKIGDSAWRKSKFYEYINPIIDPYNRFKSELQLHGLRPYEMFENPENDDMIIVKIQTYQGILTFDVPIKKITSSTSYVFIFWIIFTIFLTSILSIIFFRNQIKLIRKLSESAEKFGRGQDVENLRPLGSLEIRSLTISFIKMKERVLRQITQRTDMLSAVSHDLRTPLTRMKLQLEMMNNSVEIDELKNDVNDMERLINEYLDFAKFDDKEKAIPVNIKEFLFAKVINYYDKMNRQIIHHFKISNQQIIELKELAFKRAIINLIDNAFNYGNKVMINVAIKENYLVIEIEDDGPGIPEHERNNVFKPFYRIDNSRNLDSSPKTGGSGLGMAIAFDAIVAHGGSIKLNESKKLGGLKVEIKIPC